MCRRPWRGRWEKKTGKLRDIFWGFSFPSVADSRLRLLVAGVRGSEGQRNDNADYEDTTERESVGNFCKCGSKAGK